MNRLARLAFLLVVIAASAGLRAGAQSFQLSVAATPNPVIVSNTVLFTTDITNTSGTGFAAVFVTNTLPASMQFRSATNSLTPIPQPGLNDIFISGQLVLFRIDNFTNGASARLSVVAQSTELGTFTNFVATTASGATNVTTNVAVRVVTGISDLGLTLTGPPTNALVNDHMTYSLTVSNLGPSTAPSVVLSNRLAPEFVLLSVTPASQSFTNINNTLVFNLGALGSGASVGLQVTVRPTNSGSLQISADVSAANVSDTNAANNAATNTVNVMGFGPGQLEITSVSTQRYNPQTGLMEQTIRVSNVGTTEVASARLIVTGLTNVLYNATGTNNGNPFVVFNGTLGTNAPTNFVDFLLEYFIPSRLPVTNLTFTAVEVPMIDLTVPTNNSVVITLVTNLFDGRILIEFAATPGSSYSILYADNMSFSNTMIAQPPIIAPANRVQWIDDGPPKTISKPLDATNRFYRVRQN